MDPKKRLASLEGFDWDDANRSKNYLKHEVQPGEAEETFFNQPLLIQMDSVHSSAEERYKLLGRTAVGRTLFVAFTIRGRLIRVISARDQSRQERRIYEKIEANPEV